jgi:PAN domain-containing protein
VEIQQNKNDKEHKKTMRDSTQSAIVWPSPAISLTRLFIFAVLILGSVVLTMFSWSAFAVDGTNLPGHDYDHFNAPSAFVCRNTCGGESRCQAYTWVKPGFQGQPGYAGSRTAYPTSSKTRAAIPVRAISSRKVICGQETKSIALVPISRTSIRTAGRHARPRVPRMRSALPGRMSARAYKARVAAAG